MKWSSGVERKTVYAIYILIIILLASVGGCKASPSPVPTAVYTSPITFQSPVATSSPPAIVTAEPGRMLTVLESFTIAQKQAQEWNPNALWTAIMPTTVVASNFGFPLGTEGWFFKFELADSPVEYFIHVSDGTISGSSEAQPLIEPSYQFVPLEFSDLEVDSKDVLSTFLDSEEGQEYISKNQAPRWEYRLLHLEGTQHPVWSLFDAAHITVSLISIDAITGEIVSDPF